MRTVAVIQARMGSSRLPGKVLLEIAGCSMLSWVVTRTRRAKTLEETVVATTFARRDDAIEEACRALHVPVVRGPDEDVLARYCMAAEAFRADPIVRITSDCPLIDPEIVDRVVAAFFAGGADYASNCLERSYPRGLDVEVFSRAALEMARLHSVEPYERVHVTPYIYQHPQQFALLSVPCSKDLSHLRWTVDCSEDLDLVRRIVAELGPDDHFGWRDALEVVQRKPALSMINEDVQQKALEDG